MNLHDRVLIVVVACLVFVSGEKVALTQTLTKEAVYRLDVMRSGSRAASVVNVANYWAEIGLNEIQKLRSRKRSEFGNQAEKLAQLDALFAEYKSLKVHKSDGSVDEDAVKLMNAFFSDNSVAQQVFDILGPEHSMQVVLERNIYHLQMLQEKVALQDVGELQTIFSLPLFLKALQVEGEQAKEVEAAQKASQEDYRSTVKMQMDALRNASHDRWQALLAQLNASQRGKAVRMMGQPVEWFRVEKQPEFRQHGIQPDGTLNYGGSWVSTDTRELAKILKRGDERWLIDTPDEEFEKLGYTCVDVLSYYMLFDKLLWDELEFSAEQRKALALRGKFRLSLLVKSKIRFRPGGLQRFESLLEGKAEYPKQFHEFFLRDQLDWFRQVETQIRTGQKYDSSVGLLHPAVAKYLGLTGEQKIAMQKIAADFEKQTRSTLKQILEERRMAHARSLARTVKILDESQRKKFETLTGQEISE
jgi:hypothetical protein